MASVYFDPALGGDGSTVTDDNNATTGLGNNGHRTKFVPALSQTVVMAGTATTKAAEAAASASTASTAATTATTKAGEAAASASAAAASALSASNDADDVATALATIAGGPVVSINGETGIVTLNASEVPFTPTGSIAATNTQAAIAELDVEKAKLTGGNTFSGVQLFSDGRIAQAMLKDTGLECRIAGTLSGAQAISYADGSHQRFQVGGTITLSFTNWPPTSNNGTLLIELVNGGAFQVNFPSAINWIKSNGATTTDFSQLGITLQASGTDFILLWTRDAGTTVYGKVVR